MPDGLRAEWRAATGCAVHEALGMTEVSTYISGSPERPALPGTAGWVQAGRRVAVLGEDGVPLARGEVGALAVHRADPGLMLGYVGDETATAARFSPIHKAREDVACVIHTHSGAGVSVSAQKGGLMNLTQHAMRFHGRMAYHDYEGVALDMDEQQRLQADLGQHNAMILRNHGLLTCGRSVSEAFDGMYYLERACQAQIGALAGNAEVIVCSDAVAEKVAQQFERPGRASASKHWVTCLRLLDRLDPSFRH